MLSDFDVTLHVVHCS